MSDESSQKPAKVRVGIIGTGGIALTHRIGYSASNATVAAICDVNADTLATRQREWEVGNGYTDYREMLANPAIEAVSICTPNSTHGPITMAAAAAGKHVLCEKPVSMSLVEAQHMIDACNSAGVVFQVGHHMRSWVAAQRAKEMIDRGDIGTVTFARFRQAHDWGGASQVRGVFGSKALSGGGTLLDNGCHLFDLARYLCGDVANVFARTATLKFDVEVDDTAMSSLEFISGALGQVEVAWTATGFQEAFWVYGTHGSIEVDSNIGVNILRHRTRPTPSHNWSDTDCAVLSLVGATAHTRHVKNFLAAIAGRRAVVCTGRDGREAVRLVLASYESAQTGALVRLTSRRSDEPTK